MWLPPRLVRRICLPITFVVLVLIAVALGLVCVLSILIAPFSSRNRPMRIAAFGLSYCLMELVVIVAAGALWLRHVFRRRSDAPATERWKSAHRTLLASLKWLIDAATRWVDFEVLIAPSSQDAALSAPNPVLLLARHGGLGDSFVLVHLLLNEYDRSVLIVLKDILQLDPALDLILNRLGCVFLSANSGAEDIDELSLVAGALGPQDTLLIFPEGANWTPNRRRRVIQRLRREQRTEAARTATLMEHVLPPRPAGIAACLDAKPDLTVCIAAHAGLDRWTTVQQVWDAMPLRVPMTVRVWPSSPPPADPDAIMAWLTLEWAVVDEWIDSYHAGVIDQPAGGAVTDG